jgi:dTDP-glucose 4,6-dehydratase
VTDTVEGFIKAAESDHAIGEVINLGTGREISIGALAQTILQTMGKKIPVVSESQRVRPENSEVERLCAENRKARELLGWQPQFSLEEGLVKTIEWLCENHEQYRNDVYVI